MQTVRKWMLSDGREVRIEAGPGLETWNGEHWYPVKYLLTIYQPKPLSSRRLQTGRQYGGNSIRECFKAHYDDVRKFGQPKNAEITADGGILLHEDHGRRAN